MMRVDSKKPLRILFAALGFGLVAAGSYFLYTSLTVKKPVIQVPSAVAQASLKKRTPQQVSAYTVPPTHPRLLTIGKLGVSAAILPVGATNNVLNAPASAWDAGWYDKSALPGSGTGALLIDGHVNDALGSPGVFYSLGNLARGDEIGIERGDKRKFTYEVTSVQDIPVDKVDMASALESTEPGKEGLTLITCGGSYDYKKETFDHRVLVFAVRKG